MSRRAWFQLGALFILYGVAAWVASFYVGSDDWWAHGAWCVSGLALIVPTLARAIRLGVGVIITDHFFMFTISFALYFLFGASMLALGSEYQIERAFNYFLVDAIDAMRVNAVNAIGFGLALITGALNHGRWLARQAKSVASIASKIPNEWSILFFLSIGVFASAVTLPVDFGLNEEVVSGIWRTARKFLLVAIFLGCVHRGRGQRALFFLSALVAMADSVSGLLLLNKTHAMLPLAAFFSGLSFRMRSSGLWAISLILLAVIFVSIADPVSQGREILEDEGAVENRVNVLTEGLSANSSELGEEDQYSPWARFCYTHAQAAGLYFYDIGLGGDSIELIPWVFVPRFLFPNKPIISRSGPEFHTKITGRTGSSTGQGIFSDGYYNGGWLGLVLASVLCGWVLAQTSAIARAVFSQRALFLLPFAFLGTFTAFRIDGHFISDYLGAFIFILYPLLAASLLIKALRW